MNRAKYLKRAYADKVPTKLPFDVANTTIFYIEPATACTFLTKYPDHQSSYDSLKGTITLPTPQHINPQKNFHRRVRRNWNALPFTVKNAIAKEVKSRRNEVTIDPVVE